MKISVFGLGYVGSVSAACMADMGFKVIGVDLNAHKVDMINAAKPPVVEPGLAELMERCVKNGALRATTDVKDAVNDSDISFLCVGTPSKNNGDMDLESVERVCDDIGKALAQKDDFHVLVMRSTVLPGTMRQVVIPVLEKASGKKAGVDFGVCSNPEFMREGCAVHDFQNPAKIVIGATDQLSGDKVQAVYIRVPRKIIRCAIEVAEMVKYADNAWHATKVVFANEIGNLCKSLDIDSHAVMDIFCSDTRLNISPHYLKPGFAFGGSCLPKDIRALRHKAYELGVTMPLIESLLVSNKQQVKRGLDMILAYEKKSIGFLGLSFKAGTDDARESPLVDIVKFLHDNGYAVHAYDSNIRQAILNGSNQDYIKHAIPGIDHIMVNDIDELLKLSEVIVIGNKAPEFSGIASKLRPGQTVIDFVRINEIEAAHKDYHGVCW